MHDFCTWYHKSLEKTAKCLLEFADSNYKKIALAYFTKEVKDRALSYLLENAGLTPLSMLETPSKSKPEITTSIKSSHGKIDVEMSLKCDWSFAPHSVVKASLENLLNRDDLISAD